MKRRLKGTRKPVWKGERDGKREREREGERLQGAHPRSERRDERRSEFKEIMRDQRHDERDVRICQNFHPTPSPKRIFRERLSFLHASLLLFDCPLDSPLWFSACLDYFPECLEKVSSSSSLSLLSFNLKFILEFIFQA